MCAIHASWVRIATFRLPRMEISVSPPLGGGGDSGNATKECWRIYYRSEQFASPSHRLFASVSMCTCCIAFKDSTKSILVRELWSVTDLNCNHRHACQKIQLYIQSDSSKKREIQNKDDSFTKQLVVWSMELIIGERLLVSMLNNNIFCIHIIYVTMYIYDMIIYIYIMYASFKMHKSQRNCPTYFLHIPHSTSLHWKSWWSHGCSAFPNDMAATGKLLSTRKKLQLLAIRWKAYGHCERSKHLIWAGLRMVKEASMICRYLQ